jgi:hypothetical protein
MHTDIQTAVRQAKDCEWHYLVRVHAILKEMVNTVLRTQGQKDGSTYHKLYLIINCLMTLCILEGMLPSCSLLD